MVGKALENTCTAILTSELVKRGIPAKFEESFWSQAGLRKPDIFIEHKGIWYILEAKKSPTKLVDALADAYKKKEELRIPLNPKFAFAVLYDSQDCHGKCEVTVLLNTSPHIISEKTKTIEDLAEWIKEIIINPPKPAEINTSHIVNLLKQSVSILHPLFAKLGEKDIHDIFGGK